MTTDNITNKQIAEADFKADQKAITSSRSTADLYADNTMSDEAPKYQQESVGIEYYGGFCRTYC